MMTSCIEYRGEDDPDVLPYRHERREDVITVAHAEEGAHAKDLLMSVLRGVIGELVQKKVRPTLRVHATPSKAAHLGFRV